MAGKTEDYAEMSGSVRPLISVVTVVRNEVNSLENTLCSVRASRGVEVEHIVVDGGSSDGTLGILERYQSDRLRWFSESDKGIYDAMNKGIACSRGDWLLFLGADDVLASSSVLEDIFLGRDLSAYDMVCGRSCYQNGRCCVPKLDWRTYIFNTIHHQAAFYRRRLFDSFRYRTDISVVADYEMNFLLYIRRRSVLFLNDSVAMCGSEGVSHTSSQLATQIDLFRIRGRHVNLFVNLVVFSIGLLNYAVTTIVRR